jgi:hypothetical protein
VEATAVIAVLTRRSHPEKKKGKKKERKRGYSSFSMSAPLDLGRHDAASRVMLQDLRTTTASRTKQ